MVGKLVVQFLVVGELVGRQLGECALGVIPAHGRTGP
jgi:hypothetical protein